jgi:Xaa-Pro aminopeptidase
MHQSVGGKHMPEISIAEYEERLDFMQRAMAHLELDALLVYSWKRGQVRYISGYKPNYVANVAMVVVPSSGEPTLLIRFPFDLERAGKMSWLSDIRASGDFAGLARDCRTVLGERGRGQGRIGLVSGDFVVDEMPHSLYEMLKTALPESEFVPALPLFEKARLRKSPAEAELTRESARVADEALAAAEKSARAGHTEHEVVAAAEAAARARGAEEILSVIAPAASELVGPPESRVIGEEEMLVVEFAVQVEGYYTQVPGVFHTGTPTAEQRDMYDVAYRGYLAGMKAARPGSTVGDVARAELAALEETGWLEWHEYDLGHGDGLDHPEVPAITPTSELLIEPGMVLCIHPGLRKPGVGGVFVGGTVLVGDEETTPLHRVPPTL